MIDTYKEHEERLLAAYQAADDALQALRVLALEDGDLEKARMLAEKTSALAGLFEMGAYHEASCFLELALTERDADAATDVMRQMLEGADTIGDFTRSPLFSHLSLRTPDESYLSELKSDLMTGFRNDDAYAFLHDDERWKELVNA